ncbi:MAG: ABC transporter permease [Burkholderiaceae bacterium]|nr:MAG: ABC transporter permease [Burkholderiaceae bacterium]
MRSLRRSTPPRRTSRAERRAAQASRSPTSTSRRCTSPHDRRRPSSLRPRMSDVDLQPPSVAKPVRRVRRPLLRFVAVRMCWLFATLFIISVLVFMATQALPGDPAQAILGRSATPERVEILRERLGLNKPLLDQYTSWLGGILHGDFGASAVNDSTVWSLIGSKIANSLWLMMVVTCVAVPVSVALSLASAGRQGRALDRVVNGATIVLAALPEFVVALTLVVLFATGLFHWFPAVSLVFDSTSVMGSPDVVVLPALTLTLLVVPYLIRLVRASAIEVIDSEYIRAAQLRGVTGWRLLGRHAFPNVAAPMLQAIVLTTVYLVGGAVIVETVFSFPGVGLALVQAVRVRDLPTIQAIALVIAALYLMLKAVADVLTLALTPRLRLARS